MSGKYHLVFVLFLIVLLVFIFYNTGSDSSLVEVSTDEMHCLSWVDSELSMLLMSDAVNASRYFLTINETVCEYFDVEGQDVSKGVAFGSCGQVGQIWDSFVEPCGSFAFYLVVNGANRDMCLLLNEEVVFSDLGDEGRFLGSSCGA